MTLLGQAGTGKTLLTLAAGLTQTMEQRRFNEIIITRATISVGEDIGFLPGTEEEKMAPWLGAIDDNLEVLNRGSGNGSDWGRRASEDLIRSRIRIKSMSFMRGRTFLNKFVIIDEAQNLTPKHKGGVMTLAVMLQGTASDVGKSVLVAGLCRIFHQDGLRTAPFKSQNMALNSGITPDGKEMGRAQIFQAEAAGIAPDVRMNPILLKPTSDRQAQVVLMGQVATSMDAVSYRCLAT